VSSGSIRGHQLLMKEVIFMESAVISVHTCSKRIIATVPRVSPLPLLQMALSAPQPACCTNAEAGQASSRPVAIWRAPLAKSVERPT